MLYLVYSETPADVGTRLDFEEGGPGQLFEYMMNRFKPQAMYIEAGTRNGIMVADLDVTQMQELAVVLSKKFGTYPEFTPLIPAAEIPEMAAKMIDEVKKMF